MIYRILHYFFPQLGFALRAIPVFSHLDFKRIEECYKFQYPDDEIKKYKKIFLITFIIGREPKLSEHRLLKYLQKKLNRIEKKALIITNDSLHPLIQEIATYNNVTVRYIPCKTLEKYGILYNYHLYINSKQKIRRIL
jgi:hypothetical protein